jgi:signal transduction histidine kinase
VKEAAMRSRSETTLRAGALALFAALVLAELGDIALASGLNDQPQLSYPYRREVSEHVGLMASAVVGLLVTWARPRNPIGWLISLTGSSLVLNNLLQTYGARSVVFPDEDLPFGTAAMSLGAPLWIPAVAIPVTLMLVRYPTGTIHGGWARRFDRVVMFGFLLLYVGYATSPTSVTDVVRGHLPPWHVPVPVADGFAMCGAVLMLTGLVGIVVDAIRRAIRSDQRERMALILVTLATVLAVVTIFFGPAEWMGSVAFVGILVAVAVGVLRYQALGIEVVVRRTLIYATLTGLVLLVFVGLVTGFARLLPSGPTPQLVAAAVIAVGLAPARDRIQGLIDRMLYGERSEPWSALRRLGSPGAGTNALVPDVLAALAGGLHVAGARLEAPDGSSLAAWGVCPDDAQAVPLELAGEAVGVLRLGPRRGETRLGPADLRLLEGVAPLVAAVIQSGRLTDDLRAERTRVLEATHSERGRLRQDLHDGLGPSLTGIGLGLEALQSRVTSDEDLVARLRVEVSAALEEIRRIIDDLRPTALDDHGLVGALQRRVDQVSGHAGLEVSLDSPDTLPDVPPQVELAAFRIADEALTNVVRHANARHCTVRLSADGEFHLAIADDGRGVGAGRQGGVGLASMRDRAERLGGHFTLTSLTPGTEVRVELPLGAMS